MNTHATSLRARALFASVALVLAACQGAATPAPTAVPVKPTDAPNPRVTLEVENARETERALRHHGVTISDPVERYGGALVGAFLDSEGNKLWFCSAA